MSEQSKKDYVKGRSGEGKREFEFNSPTTFWRDLDNKNKEEINKQITEILNKNAQARLVLKEGMEDLKVIEGDNNG